MDTDHFYFTYPWTSFAHTHLYYRRFRIKRLSNTDIPAKHRYTIIVSNHQNSLNDAMGIVMAEKGTKVWFLARADVFKSKVAAFFLNAYGLMPVYRVRDGLANVKNNLEIFDNIEQKVLRHCPISLFPEAKHQDRRYLGHFHLSYTRLAFSVAERLNFQEDVYILPVANHYSDYFAFRPDMLLTTGEYISLKPYYELYKENPRKAQNEVNDVVRAKVQSMMLDIQEVEHYDDIYNMLSNYGVTYAIRKGINPNNMYDKLCTDKAIVAKVEAEKEHDADNFEQVCQLSHDYTDILKQHGINDKCVRKLLPVHGLIMQLLYVLLCMPVALCGIAHHIIPILIPKYLSRNMKDKLMRPSVDLGLTVVFTFPILYILCVIIYGNVFHSFLIGLLCTIVVMLTGFYADEWRRTAVQCVKNIRAWHIKCGKPSVWSSIQHMRARLVNSVDEIMNR